MFTYKFDKQTGEYLYAEKAILDPLETAQFVSMPPVEKDEEGNELPVRDDRLERLEEATQKVYLLPADSTFDIPPYAKEGYAARWNGKAWELVEDHRQKQGIGGTPYWMPGDDWQTPARYMAELGHLPKGAKLKKPEKPAEVVEREQLQAAKATRAALVEKSTVTVDGMVFDADETSQNRLVRGIVCSIALGLAPDETTEWTLSDNTSAQVTAQQMARALLAAGQYQTSVWRMPYELETPKNENLAEVMQAETDNSAQPEQAEAAE